MIEELANKDFEKTSNSIKIPDEAVDVVSNIEKIIRSKNFDIFWLAYQQGQYKFYRYN